MSEQSGRKKHRIMTKKRRRHTPEQIIRKLAESHKELASGKELDEWVPLTPVVADAPRWRKRARPGNVLWTQWELAGRVGIDARLRRHQDLVVTGAE